MIEYILITVFGVFVGYCIASLAWAWYKFYKELHQK